MTSENKKIIGFFHFFVLIFIIVMNCCYNACHSGFLDIWKVSIFSYFCDEHCKLIILLCSTFKCDNEIQMSYNCDICDNMKRNTLQLRVAFAKLELLEICEILIFTHVVDTSDYCEATTG